MHSWIARRSERLPAGETLTGQRVQARGKIGERDQALCRVCEWRRSNQLLARQTIHAAARAHGLRVSFAPLVTADGVGNGWHIHSSLWRGDDNLLGGDAAPRPEGTSYIAGLLRDLPAITAVTAPSVPSLARLLRERVCVLGSREPRGRAALRPFLPAARLCTR
jgi:hypothetical protein